MFDETPLNPNLKSLEAALRGLPAPSSDLTRGSRRDDLMYQAGWAAALASLDDQTAPNSATTTPPIAATTSTPRWLWPTATLVATAAAIWLSVLLIQDPTKNQNVVAVTETVEASDDLIEEQEVVEAPNADARTAKPRSAPQYDLVRDVFKLPRGRILNARLAFSGRAYPVATIDTKASEVGQGGEGDFEPRVRRVQTQRQLLQEFLDRS